MPAAASNSQASSPEHKVATALPVASMLAFTGGILDAFLYLVHGHVFAGAMTGNVVLCGVALGSGNGASILHHSMPLLAFACGVLASSWLQARAPARAVSLCLTTEIVGLTVAALLPVRFPDLPYVFAIVFLTAFQIGTFSTADRFSYSSTYVTGDLRTLCVGLFKAMRPGCQDEGRRQSRDLAAILGCFLVGAVLAALVSPHWGNRTLWLPVATLSLVLGAILRQTRQAKPDSH